LRLISPVTWVKSLPNKIRVMVLNLGRKPLCNIRILKFVLLMTNKRSTSET